MQRRARVLFLLSLAECLAMSLWFIGGVVAGQPAGASPAEAARHLQLQAWLTMAGQIGFVGGALLIATFNLSDVFRPSRVFVVCSVLAAAANAGLALTAEDLGRYAGDAAQPIWPAIASRALTGAFLAGVYPTGMKILAGWFREGRGLALGVLIGALTLGSASPHLFYVAEALLTHLPVAAIAWAASVSAALAAIIVALGVHEGPFVAPAARFNARQIGSVFTNRRVRLANFGYLGHMWELYSMWGWIAAMLLAASPATGMRSIHAIAFLVIAIGCVGCVWAGSASDRAQSRPASERLAQRSRVTIVAMAASASCAVAAALAFDHAWLLILICCAWGVAVIADSAQFSAIVTEVADPDYVGTALTTQTAMGFLLTAVSLRVVAAIAANYGWRWATASLAVGPLLGIWAMSRLMSQAPVTARTPAALTAVLEEHESKLA